MQYLPGKRSTGGELLEEMFSKDGEKHAGSPESPLMLSWNKAAETVL